LSLQGEPPGSNLQVGEQQSPAAVLPSSHCSPASTRPFPQTTITHEGSLVGSKTCVHASAASLQASSVQMSASAQLRAAPPAQTPAPLQVSPVVQKSPSLQAEPFGS
jgi:hypothetical protein